MIIQSKRYGFLAIFYNVSENVDKGLASFLVDSLSAKSCSIFLFFIKGFNELTRLTSKIIEK